MNGLADMDTPHSCRTFTFFASDRIETQCSQLKESSMVKYRNNKHLLDQFGALSPADIGRDNLFLFSRALLSSGLSPRSITMILSTARSILRYARLSGVPAEDPGPIPLKQGGGPPSVFSRSEQERLTAYLLGRDDMGSRGILLSLYTGLRIGELCFDVKTLSEILGHSSVNITLNRYVHPSMECKRENMDRLTALLPR